MEEFAQVFSVNFIEIIEVYILNLTRGDFYRAYYRRHGIIIQYEINQTPSIIHHPSCIILKNKINQNPSIIHDLLLQASEIIELSVMTTLSRKGS